MVKRAGKLEVLLLNPIAQVGLKRLPAERFSVVRESKSPDVILVRSADMHGMAFDTNLKAVARAGAGTNNIPIPALSALGVPVFSAPGANANAVKELVVAGMLMAARNLAPALDFVNRLDKSAKDLEKQV
ncbi:MAG: 3-phosphoglycerate dehydrogenase, partial [Proteobacteria bacterium]|nr:3-phosphoglycerate dehydrogenase [Pseudomonadota bacterium]